jgi:trk system potassium uptake protein TrkA
MKIIIAGAGEVGFHLAKLLSFESQDITLIDTNRDSLAYADSHLDIRVVRGDATSIAILTDANIEGTDLVVAVTESETTNITVCVLAKQLGAKRTIARISNTEFIEKKDEVGFTKFGIDELISPESLAADEIELLLTQSAFNDTYQFEGGALTMIGLSLSRTASFVGKTVSDLGKLFPDLECVPVAIQRFGTQYTVIPKGNTQFKEGDQVYFITTPEGVDEIYKLTGKVHEDIKNVMILGGSKIGHKTAKDLCKSSFKVKLVEKDKEKAFEIADQIPGCLVINGDGRNVEMLIEESLNVMDALLLMVTEGM